MPSVHVENSGQVLGTNKLVSAHFKATNHSYLCAAVNPDFLRLIQLVGLSGVNFYFFGLADLMHSILRLVLMPFILCRDQSK